MYTSKLILLNFEVYFINMTHVIVKKKPHSGFSPVALKVDSLNLSVTWKLTRNADSSGPTGDLKNQKF